MSLTTGRLPHMANQIARNLAARGADVAAAETAEHIAAFWDPGMKEKLLTIDPAAFDPIAAKAVDLFRQRARLPLSATQTASGGSDAG